MNSHIGYTVRCCGFIHGSITLDGTRLVGLLVLRAEQGGNLSNGFIRFLLWNCLFNDVLVFRLLNHELAEVDSTASTEFFLTEDIVFHLVVVLTVLLHANVLAKSRLKPSPFPFILHGIYDG